MPVSSSTEHWIKSDALTINLNYFGDPDYLQVSVLAGAVVMAFKQDVIGYNAAHNYRIWPLEAANTYLETSSAYNVYARLTRSEMNARALIVYDTVLRDIEGREITYAENGSENLGDASADYFFVFMGQISGSVDSNGKSVQREWLIDFRFGVLDTTETINEDIFSWRKLFIPHYEDPIDPTKLSWIEVKSHIGIQGGATMFINGKGMNLPSIYDGLPIDSQTIYWEAIKDDNGVVIGKVLKAQGGGGTGGGGVADSVAWSNVYGKPIWLLDDKINYSEIEGTPNLSVYQLKITSDNKLDYSLIGNTPDLSLYQSKITSSNKLAYSLISGTPDLSLYQAKITSTNKLAYSLISGTPDLSVYALKENIPSLSGYATEQWVKDRGYATTDDLDSRINSLIDGAPAAYDTLKEIADVLSGNVNSIGDIITTLGTKANQSALDETNETVKTKWTQDDTKISNWDTAYGWGNHANAGYAKKIDIEGKYVTIAGDEDITGLHNFTNGFKIGGNRIYETKDGIIYIDANVILKGGLTMYGDENADIPSILESIPTAGYDKLSARGMVAFNSNQFVINNGVVSAIQSGGGLDVDELKYYLTQNGYATQDWVVSQNYLSTSSYTASDILTKLKTVDGTNSGLDADMLDGKDSIDFFRILGTNNNLDSFGDDSKLNGVVYINRTMSGTSNAPFDYGTVLAINSYAGSWMLGNSSSGSLMYRNRWWSANGYDWSSWKTIAFTDSNVASATKLNDDSAFNIWGQTFFVGGKPKSVDGAMTVNGNATFNGNVSATEVSVNGITLKKSKDGILYLDGNLVVKGGVTMYGTDSSSAPSILDSLPVASTSAKGIAQFSSTYFYVSDGVVSIKDGSVGLNESELNEILNSKGYLVSSDLGALAFKSNLLAADIPSLDWSKITSGKPTTLDGYGITDSVKTGVWINTGDTPLVNTTGLEQNIGSYISLGWSDGWKIMFRNSARGIEVRHFANANDSGWKTIAFTDSNVASATKLNDDSAYSVWGQTFFVGGKPQSVSGDLSDVGNVISSGAFIGINSSKANESYFGNASSGVNGDGALMYAYGGRNLYFYTNGVERIRVDSLGNVGIDTPNPAYKLDVVGASRSTYMWFWNRSFNGNAGYIGRGSGANNSIYLHSVDSLRFGTGGVDDKMILDTSGNLLVTGAVTFYSQRSLKNVVDERGLSLDELSTIKPTRYTWKDGRDSNIHFGGIADDIQQVLPEVVYNTAEGVLTMDYGNAGFAIAASLIKPVVDHEQRIKALEKENEMLKQELNRLRA